MSNVLQFRSFHERHFSAEQVNYWQQHVLNRQQPSAASQWQQHNNPSYGSWPSHHDYYHYNNYPSEGVENNMEKDVDMTERGEELNEEEEEQNQQQSTLSQEAIEIFKFSEAYRKEREESAEVVEEEEEHDTWITDAYRNGTEAPVTCLVYHSKDSGDTAGTTAASSSSSEHLRIQEHLLNSAYLDACREGQAILWPVLPLRL